MSQIFIIRFSSYLRTGPMIAGMFSPVGSTLPTKRQTKLPTPPNITNEGVKIIAPSHGYGQCFVLKPRETVTEKKEKAREEERPNQQKREAGAKNMSDPPPGKL